MKKYIAPEMEIVKFSAQDIVTVSGTKTIEDKGGVFELGKAGGNEHTYVGLN